MFNIGWHRRKLQHGGKHVIAAGGEGKILRHDNVGIRRAARPRERGFDAVCGRYQVRGTGNAGTGLAEQQLRLELNGQIARPGAILSEKVTAGSDGSQECDSDE